MAISLLLVAGGVAVAIAALAFGRNAAQQSYDRLLIGAANQIAGAITLREGAVSVDLPVSAFQLLALAPEDRIVYAVFAPDGRLVNGYGDLSPPQADDTIYDGEFAGEPVRLAVARRLFAERTFSGTVSIVVGQTTRARADLAWRITSRALIVVGVAGLLMCGLAVFAVRSALRPLRQIERELLVRAPEDLTPLEVSVPREIGSLVRTMNRFMARLDRQVGVMRTLIADASHQLRTPIAALRAQADLAAEETDPEKQRAIVARIHQRAVNLSRLTDQLLSYALIIHRADAEPRGRIDLRTVAIRALEESDHDLFACEAELRLDLPEDPVWVDGDALSLVEACKNLIMNALRYGAPPVKLMVQQVGNDAQIAVRDRGPGIPEEHWQDAVARYSRNSGVSPESAGVGLAIVHAVARAHRGELRFGRTSAAEFEVALVLPAGKGGDR